MPQVALVAGEASGDRLGASFISAAREFCPELEFVGVAGPEMRASGCTPWFGSEELGVMGLFEVLRHLPRLRARVKDVERQLASEPPDLLVGIDAPDFNLRIAARARQKGIPTVQYVCPSVWAWRSRRVKKIRAACDKVLCLLPFEPEFLARHGIDGEFVGHPLADAIPLQVDRQAARQRLGLQQATLVGVMPGSRQGELERLGPVFAQTVAWLAGRRPQLAFAAPMAAAPLREAFAEDLRRFAPECSVRLFDGHAHDVMAASDVLLVASGTATLEAMLHKRPMVVAYRLAPLTYALLRALRMVRAPAISLPNLLAGRALVPELLQQQVTSATLGAELLAWLDSDLRRRDFHQQALNLHQQLRCGAAARAARAALGVASLI